MSTEENKAVSNRMAEAIGEGDFDAFDELMAPELTEEFKQDLAELRLAFPDYHGTNEIQVAEGEMVANRFVFYGTHQREFMGVHLRFGRTCVPSACAKDIPTSGCAHTSFESLRPPRVPARRKPRTSQPTSVVGDRKLLSDPCVTGTLEA